MTHNKTRNEVYLAIVEGWLRANRGTHFTQGAVDDLCDRIATGIEQLRAEAADYKAEGERHIKTIAELRHENARLLKDYATDGANRGSTLEVEQLTGSKNALQARDRAAARQRRSQR